MPRQGPRQGPRPEARQGPRPEAGGRAASGRGFAAVPGSGQRSSKGPAGAAAGSDSRQQPPMDVFKMGRLLLTSRDPALRAFAARALGNSGRKTAYAFLRKALLDPEETVVRSAVASIGKLSILQSAGELAALYARSDVAVRKDVLLCVRSILPGRSGRTPTTDGFMAIAAIAERDTDPEIRSMAANLLRGGG